MTTPPAPPPGRPTAGPAAVGASPDGPAAAPATGGTPLYPLGLRLAGRRVLVVGGGTVAQRRVPALLDAGADVLLVAPAVTPTLEGLAASRRLSWQPRPYAEADLAGAWLVLALTDSPEVNAAVAAAADTARVLCVRADDAAAGSAWTPAVGRHDGVTVAVHGGRDPRRAAAVRDQVVERLADGTLDAPRHRAPARARTDSARTDSAWPDSVQGTDTRGDSAEAPRTANDSAEASGTPGRSTEGNGNPGRGRGDSGTGDSGTGDSGSGDSGSGDSGSGDSGAPGNGERTGLPGVALVGGGPGDPELITVRGRRLLARADVVVVDRLAPHLLLDELPAAVEVVDAAKIPYGRYVAQEEINRALVENALAGRFVVRLKGGDPFVFGRGGEELEACLAAGVPVEVVPGVTSAVAVPAVAGIPVTHRGVSHELVVVSGHVAPGDPRSLVDWPALARLRGTLVLLMAVERLEAICAVLVEHGRPGGTPVAVVQDGTVAGQRSVAGTLATIVDRVAAAGISHPAVVVVGEVVAVAERLAALAPVSPQPTPVSPRPAPVSPRPAPSAPAPAAPAP